MVETSSADRLFVTKIPQAATREDVAAHFARFGTTTDVYVPSIPGSTGHKGIAFVSYADPSSAQLAINNGPHEICGHEVVLDVATPRGNSGGGGKGAPTAAPSPYRPSFQPQARYSPAPTARLAVAPAPAPSSSDRIFVTKVPPHLTKEHLAEHFAQFGDLSDCYMPAVPGNSGHKGIAFVSFVDPAAVSYVLQNIPHEVAGHQIVVDIAAPRVGVPGEGGGKGRGGSGGTHQAVYLPAQQAQLQDAPGEPVPGRIFCTRVPPDVTKVDLQMYFQQYGQLDDVFVPSGGKGIAFVSFAEPEIAEHALKVQQHTVMPGKIVLVEQAMERPALDGGKGKGGKGGGFGARPRFAPY